ncbi:uracil-DNA glycosylase [Paracoccus sp. S-4012]|uniref:uracil-DNA glycosylase n=1 Tax=Paracoccus sp. S-4012 TaxID=2665648 RepID=UPI0012B109CA|nr:uracil-DNA glycosylase [Paracoccus sp. S-4012]MRX49783.1 uracil-DNA glycosylase [Paracoccus sp. S-4012]
MTMAPRFRGIEIDGATALALLDWQREMGVDEAILDAPVDRLEAPPPPPVPAAPEPAPALPLGDDVVAAAERLAAQATDLASLAELQRGFDGIELKRGARSFVFADGNPAARLMVIGEAPGEEEDAQGRPFVGRAGQLLDQMLAAIGLSRAAPDPDRAVYIANVLTWRPPANRRPEPQEIAASMPFLARHVELADPEVIVLMGNTPCQAVLGRQGILRLRGQWTEAFGRPALPMVHPAYLLRNPAAKREAWADLLDLSARLGL